MQSINASQPRTTATALTFSGFRTLFFAVTISGGLIFWLAPHPPMSDLAQHAGQVALLHDLLLDQSPWTHLLRINLFTPYVLAYGLSTALSFLTSVETALKLVLTLAFYGFVASYVMLRKRLVADERLDWLCIPGFFGFAYEYGFFSYLVATPIAMLFLRAALDYAEGPSLRRGITVLLVDIAVFFSHGLLFLFVSAIGGAFLLARYRNDWRKMARVGWPYAPPLALCVAYTFLHRSVDLAPMYPFRVIWSFQSSWMMELLVRLGCATVYPWAIIPDNWTVPVTLLMFAAPFFMGSRWCRNGMAYMPLAVLGILWFSVPIFAMNTAYLFHRFALFIFPFYALNFRSATDGDAMREGFDRRALLTQLAVAAVCIAFLGMQGVRALRFAKESADFEAIAAEVAPGQRVLNIVFSKDSPAAENPVVYENFALWYQADRRGLVDFNAAWFPPQVVRYRLDRLPAVGPAQVAPKPLSETFDWHRHEAWLYRYFFVRHTSPIPDRFFANQDCRVVLVRTVGNWSVYEKQSCHRQ
ncbi:hypothetical protein C9I57_14205 [Trinickia symbiotica]|uniref:Glycosyltransferase RgtA/B/C/D-like domain-containing protein n=1 Tax=Trinickia symbiotica TaxID=863227 RepID=A0A2T3XUL5_9BURK|nr:hypothetical protein [Trinickia symbiotica]PTB20226.1 hypothetical protein C9I57_14205 [Trinickia symbiotica]